MHPAGLAAENMVFEDGVVECTGVARWLDYAFVRAHSAALLRKQVDASRSCMDLYARLYRAWPVLIPWLSSCLPAQVGPEVSAHDWLWRCKFLAR